MVGVSREAVTIESIRQRLLKIDPRWVTPPKKRTLPCARESSSVLLSRALDGREATASRLEALIGLGERAAEERFSPGAEQQLATLAAKGTPPLSGAAAVVLLRNGQPDFVRAVEARLASGHRQVAATSARLIGEARHTPAAAALIELVATTAHAEVRSAAAWALGELGCSEAVEVLHAALLAHQCLVPVIEALGKVGPAETIAWLSDALHDPAAEVRLAAAQAIVRLLDRYPQAKREDVHVILKAALVVEREALNRIVLLSALRRAGVHIPPEVARRILGLRPRRSVDR